MAPKHVTGLQCRMARAALGVTLRDLAEAARVPYGLLSQLEQRGAILPAKMEGRLRQVLAEAGLELIGQDGVRLPELSPPAPHRATPD